MSVHSWRALARLRGVERRADVSERAAALALLGRFVDELLSGVFVVLVPTFRQRFDLSLLAVGLLDQVLTWVALLVEPPAALLIDVRSRRALMTFGASMVGVATVLMGLAPGFGVLVVGFALYGLGSGPLAHTADVVVVESYPSDPERAYGRATMLDTTGALLAPALVAGVAGSGLSWRVALVAVGVVGVGYAIAVRRTPMPAPAGTSQDHVGGLVPALWSNLRGVVGDPAARRSLWLLLALEALDAPDVLSYVWLHEVVGMSQSGVALYVVYEQVVGIAALAWLERRLRRGHSGRVFGAAGAALAVLYPLWLVAPGVWGRVVVGAPLAFAVALLWPIGRSRALAAVPGRGGALTAVSAVIGILPLALTAGALAELVGLTAALLVVATGSAVVLLLVSRRLPEVADLAEVDE